MNKIILAILLLVMSGCNINNEMWWIYDFTDGANFTTNVKPVILEDSVIYLEYKENKKTFKQVPKDEIVILYKHGNKEWASYYGKKVNNFDSVQIPTYDYSIYRNIRD